MIKVIVSYYFTMRQFICIAIAGAAIAGAAIVTFFENIVFYYCTCILNSLKSHKLWFWQLILVPHLYDVISTKHQKILFSGIKLQSCHATNVILWFLLQKMFVPEKQKYSGK